MASAEVDLSASRQGSLYAALITSLVLGAIAVGLRLWSRLLTKTGFWWDDWFICVALFGGFAMLANFCWWIPHGYGKHIEAFGPKADYYFYLGFFIAEFIYMFIIVFVKYSILALYLRVFRSTNIKLPIIIMATITTSWGIAVLFLSTFTCIPPKGFWDKNIIASCNVDLQDLCFGISIPNILTDVILLALPVPYILGLNTSSSQKRLLIGTFLFGGFICIASIMRLVSVVRESTGPDISWNWVDQGMWAVVETNLAMVSACLPTLRPIWAAISKRTFRKQSNQIPPNTHRMPDGVWTIGSGPNRKSRKAQMTLDEAISSIYPFTTLHDDEENCTPTSKESMQNVFQSERAVPESFDLAPLHIK